MNFNFFALLNLTMSNSSKLPSVSCPSQLSVPVAQLLTTFLLACEYTLFTTNRMQNDVKISKELRRK